MTEPTAPAVPVSSDPAQNGAEPHEPVVPISTFIARRDDANAEPLISSEQGTVFPAAGLALLVARPGKGKTTFMLDLGLNAAAGRDYIQLTFPRPLRILVIQNEGPREAFRDKLEQKLENWTGDPPADNLLIWDDPERWGLVKVSAAEARVLLRQKIEQHQIDLVIADSLTRFGVKGNGTPEETREFVEWLSELGYGRDVAFLLLHHPRKEPAEDDLDTIAGAWSAHADTILMLTRLAGTQSRLSYPKLRFARGDRAPSILNYDTATQTFEFVTAESDSVEDEELHERIENWLTEHPRVATSAVQKGVTGDNTRISKLLKAGAETGRYTVEQGPKNASLWSTNNRSSLRLVPETTENELEWR